MNESKTKAEPVAALRDCSFYACPSGFGANPRPPKYHVIIERPNSRWDARGPACGIPMHNEETETPASAVSLRSRCAKPGCKKAWAGIGHKP